MTDHPCILIADDEKSIRNALFRILATRGYRLCLAADGEEALAQAQAEHPALAILDVMMPGMNGFEVCQRIKSLDPGTMVLMLSGRAELEDRMKGYAVLADDYMVKPFDPDELLAKTGILLRLYQAQEDLKRLNRDLEKTVRKRTEELVARERQAMAGTMVRGIVHNFRGPLTVARNGMQLLRMELDRLAGTQARGGGDQAGSGVNRYVDMVSEAISSTGELVDSLLIQGGANPGETLRAIDLDEMIRKEYHFLKSGLFFHHGVEVRLDLAGGLPLITGRYSDFSQVFFNLARNACEAMASCREKVFSVASRLTPEGIELVFSDSGPGIPPEQADRLFDPFYSTKSTRDDTTSGSGLGLFICSRLMTGYGAVLSVENRLPAGAVFTLRIPLSNREKEQST